MITVNGIMVGIVILREHGVVGTRGQRIAVLHLAVVAVLVDVGNVARLAHGSTGGNVGHRHTATTLVPTAFPLISCYRAAP